MAKVELRGRRILLTGASRGIGSHVALALAQGGAKLVLTARSAEALGAIAARCEAAGAEGVTTIRADLLDADDRGRILSEAGELDVLINNAGVEYTKRLLAQSDAEVERQLALNLHVPIELCRRVLPGMLERGSGTIVNVASMSAKGPTPFNSIYAATKYGLAGFSHSLRVELHGTGVHAGVVCPGFVSEGMWGRTGLKAPAVLKEVTAGQVVRGVMKAIGGAGEVLVTAGPVRPLLALFQMFPGLEGSVMRRTGVVGVLAERAELAESGDS